MRTFAIVAYLSLIVASVNANANQLIKNAAEGFSLLAESVKNGNQERILGEECELVYLFQSCMRILPPNLTHNVPLSTFQLVS